MPLKCPVRKFICVVVYCIKYDYKTLPRGKFHEISYGENSEAMWFSQIFTKLTFSIPIPKFGNGKK